MFVTGVQTCALPIYGKEKIPVQTPFALSVRDGMNEVESGHNMLTDLLLMSEIKGYVNNPQYYFESRDDTHRKAIDLLLRVQGWRRYSWKQMTGIESLDLKIRTGARYRNARAGCLFRPATSQA